MSTPTPDWSGMSWGESEDFAAPDAAVDDLADLFNDETAPAPTPAPDAPASADTLNDAHVSEETGVEDLADLFATETPVSAAEGTRAAAAASVITASAPSAITDPDVPQPGAEPPVTVAHEPAPASAPVTVANVGRRWERLEVLYTSVDAVLGVVNSDSRVAMALQDFHLTRDRDEDLAQRRRFRALLEPLLINQGRTIIMNPADIEDVFNLAYSEVVGLGPLDELWWDDETTEILVDGPDLVYIERSGHLQLTPVRFRSLDHAQTLARTLSTHISDRSVNPSNPLVTAELPGARVTFCYGTAVVRSGISITIRKFRSLLGMEQLLGYGSLNQEMVDFLQQAVTARATTMVSGGTGSGKTSMINALSAYIPDHERIVTIEDAFELQLKNRFVVSLQTKERASGDDQVSITQADLLVNSLRMRPDRIIVGEIREPSGAQVMLQAANTGHDGTMSTIHANTADAAMNFRLAGLLRTATGMSDDVALREVATAVDLVVQVTRRAGMRFVSEISAVDISDVHGRAIEPQLLFAGEIGPDGKPQFRRVGALRGDTVLGIKFAEAGLDTTRWEKAP